MGQGGEVRQYLGGVTHGGLGHGLPWRPSSGTAGPPQKGAVAKPAGRGRATTGRQPLSGAPQIGVGFSQSCQRDVPKSQEARAAAMPSAGEHFEINGRLIAAQSAR
jgi:hypothetical protein